MCGVVNWCVCVMCEDDEDELFVLVLLSGMFDVLCSVFGELLDDDDVMEGDEDVCVLSVGVIEVMDWVLVV